jgi:hypothetical protein
MFDFFEGILQSLALAAWWKVVGIVGLGGIIAAGALAVAYFMPLLRKPAIHLAIIAGGFSFVYGWGAADQQKICAARELAAEQAAAQRDIDQGNQSEADIKNRLAELEQRDGENQEKLRDYEKALHDRQSPACVLAPSDVLERGGAAGRVRPSRR